MKKFLAMVGLVFALASVPTVANGPDPMPGCSKSCPKCCALSAADLRAMQIELGNGPDPVPACKKGSPQCP